MKYFFLSENWTTGRVWEFGGLWNEIAWNRKPHLQRQSLYVQENGENLWLYQTEDAVLMVEVIPQSSDHSAIGQVVLKRLLTPEQVIERLCKEAVFHPADVQINEAMNVETNKVEPLPKVASNHRHQPLNDNAKETAKETTRKSGNKTDRLRRLEGENASTDSDKTNRGEHTEQASERTRSSEHVQV